MNDKLFALYESKWDLLLNAFEPIHNDERLEIKPANPLLLYIDNEEEYKNADIRVMIFGQETNSWYDERGATIEDVQDLYDDFFNGKNCWTYGGQFWNGVKRFLESLDNKYPNKSTRLIWNNIVKIGKQGKKGFPPDYIYEIERENLHVIPDEIKILKPNLVLFLTGPNYDGIIKDNFGSLIYEALPDFSERQLARIKLEEVPFAYRTYHPNFLWRNDIDDYFDTIINDIEF